MIAYIISGVIGGFISLLFFPTAIFFSKRWIAQLRTRILIQNPIKNQGSDYVTLSLRILNNSFTTLENVTAFITIIYEDKNIASDPNINTYTATTSNIPLMLSWAKVTESGNSPHININQAESSDLNLFRYHQFFPIPLLQIASEQGFSHQLRKGRVLLKSDQDYFFEILLTADNMLPIRRNFRFDNLGIAINQV